MKVLITGATGFIGSALHKKLDQHTVRLTARRNILDDSVDFIKKNICSTSDFSECLADIDVVIHTAARVHQMNEQSTDPLREFMETNCNATIELARQAVDAGVKRFVFISSIKVNGEESEEGLPFRYDDDRNILGPYAQSKALAEKGLFKLAHETGLEVVIIRPPLVYGPGVKANFDSLMKLTLKNLPLPLGAIKNKRSYVALDNLLDLIRVCVDHPKAGNQIFLVSDDYDVSTTQLIEIMANAFGNRPRLIKISPAFLMLVAKVIGKRNIIDRLCSNLQVDIEHTKATLGWKPVVSMEYGVMLCVAHFRQYSYSFKKGFFYGL